MNLNIQNDFSSGGSSTLADQTETCSTAATEVIEKTLLILDRDPSTLHELATLLGGHGYQVRTFSTFSDLKATILPPTPTCLLLDTPKGFDGIAQFEELRAAGWKIPVIFLAAQWSPRCIVKAIKGGANGFLVKPFDAAELLDEVATALQPVPTNQPSEQKSADVRALAELLSAREREVVKLVMQGMLNKEIAHELGLALVTVKVHRGRAMRKLNAGNAAQFVDLARLAGLAP